MHPGACLPVLKVQFTGAIDIINTLSASHAIGALKKALAAYTKP